MLLTPIFAVLAATGCANGPNDALTGTWSNTACFGSSSMPSDIQSCSTTLEFGADLSLTLIDTRQSLPATLMRPRCTTTRRVSGQRYSTSDGSSQRTFTVSGSGTATVARSGCADPTDDSSATPDSFDPIPPTGFGYELSADTVIITSGPLAGRYSRAGG